MLCVNSQLKESENFVYEFYFCFSGNSCACFTTITTGYEYGLHTPNHLLYIFLKLKEIQNNWLGIFFWQDCVRKGTKNQKENHRTMKFQEEVIISSDDTVDMSVEEESDNGKPKTSNRRKQK